MSERTKCHIRKPVEVCESESNNTAVPLSRGQFAFVSKLIPRILETPPLQVLSKNIPILHKKLLLWS